MNLTKIAHSFGLTQEERKELSDILYETGVVESKDYHEPFSIICPCPMPAVPECGFIQRKYAAEYNVHLKGEKKSLKLNNEELFNKVNVGDKIKVSYKEVYAGIYDYVPPDFLEKKLIDVILSGYEYISAEKL